MASAVHKHQNQYRVPPAMRTPTRSSPSPHKTVVLSDFQDLLQCMICFEPYRVPKMLQCAHTFCEQCLMDYLVAYKDQRRSISGKLPCPTCRELTTLPTEGGVSGLRNDFKIHKIEEIFQTMNLNKKSSSSYSSSSSCDSCKSQNKKIKSKVYCTICKMHFCDSCHKKHSKNSLLKKHSVISRSLARQQSSSLTCKVHSGEEGRYFCKTCEQLVCTLCVMNSGEHSRHLVAEVDSIHEQNVNDLKHLQGIITSKVEHLSNKRKKLEHLRDRNLTSCLQAELSIKEVTEHKVRELKRLEVDLLKELREKRDATLKTIQNDTNTTLFYIAKAHSLQDFARSARNKTKVQMMAIHDELIKRMRTVVEVDTSIGGHDDLDRVITFIKDTGPMNIGEISGVTNTAERSPFRSIDEDHPPNLQRHLSSSNNIFSNASKAQLLFKVGRIGSSRGELRDPLGVACLLNGDIAVAEYGNKRVQLFDSVGKSLCMIGEGRLEPQDVSVSLRGNIVVTDPAHKRLEVFSPRGDSDAGESIEKWGFGKFYAPCGVAMSPNGNCIVTDIDEQTINIYKGVKHCLKRVGISGSEGQGGVKFARPLYVAVGKHNHIVVSDSDNHCIKVLSSSGSFLYKFAKQGSEDGELCFPRGVCVDAQGNIYVVDRNNNRVCMFNMQGKFICHVLTEARDGIKEPMAIAITMTRNLIITESSKVRTSLKMFQL